MYILGMKVSQVDTSPTFKVGQIGYDNSGRGYKYVKLQNTTATVAAVAGDVAGYGLSGVNDNLVVTDNTDAATKPIGAGVIQAAIAGVAGTAYYTWVQVSGKATVNQTIAGTPADGDGLFLSTTDKTLTLSTAADDPVCAFADDESAKEIVCAFPH